MAVSCLLELCADKFSQSRLRGQHLPPQNWASLDTQKKLGDMGQWEVKVCASPVSSAIDPAGFFLGGWGGLGLFSLLNLALPQRENTCSLHPVCKEGVQLFSVALLENWEDVISNRSEVCAGDSSGGTKQHMTFFIVVKYT